MTNWPPYFEFSLQNTMHAAIGVIFQNNKNMIIALSYLNLSIASYYKQNEAKMSNILDPYSPIYSHFLLCSIFYHTSSANNHLMLLVNKTQFFKLICVTFSVSNSTLQWLNNTHSKLEYSHLCITSHIFLYLSYTFVVILLRFCTFIVSSIRHKFCTQSKHKS